MFSVLSCTTVVFIFATVTIIAIAVWIVWIQQGSHPYIITDSKLPPVSEDCSSQYYDWLHENDSCPASPGQPGDGTV